jgi:hypothetical protein
MQDAEQQIRKSAKSIAAAALLRGESVGVDVKFSAEAVGKPHSAEVPT